MPQFPLPMPARTLAKALGIPDEDLLPLLASAAPEQGDPTVLALTVEEAARRIGVGRTTMYALIASGEVPSIQFGRLRRIPTQALSDYVAKLTPPARSTDALAA